MDVTTATSTTSTTSTATAPPAGAPKITSDFNTFLRMLTVQMQNQDPLNPIDSADYAVQLATFSGVEQQVKTNELLTSMATQLGLLGVTQYAGWVGMEARVAAPAYFDGTTPLTVAPNPVTGADQAVLVVKDAQGTLVSREEIPVSAEPYQWLGAGSDGNPLPAGTYSIALESLKGETVISALPVEHYARVIEARGGSNGTRLLLEGGVEVPVSAVTALREPQG